MFWYCEICNDWGLADTEVDLAVDRQRHRDTHRAPDATPPAPEEEPGEDTVLSRRYLWWGITAVLGLLSTHWPVLAGVVPCAALLALVLGWTDGD